MRKVFFYELWPRPIRNWRSGGPKVIFQRYDSLN